MNPIASAILPIIVLGLALPHPGLRADVIAQDSFEYTDGSALAGLAGGTGWDATTHVGWTVNGNIASATIQGGKLILGNGTDSPLADASTASSVARHLAASYDGDSLFIKYTFSVGPGTTANPDRFYLVINGAGAGGGWGFLEIGTGVSSKFSSRVSGATGDNKIAARVNSSVSDRVTASLPPIVDLTSYTVVVEFSKGAGGAANQYDTLRLWVNPAKSDYASATAKTLGYPKILKTINRVSLCLDEVEAGDVFRVDEVMLATTWADIFSR
ncbi:MAG TPA: hypothetical protein VIO38_13035 [Rariglobus sp.]